MEINWCPKDKIGLANEEVVDGRCRQCGTRRTARERAVDACHHQYADRLHRDLDAYLENPAGDKIFLSAEFLNNPTAFGYETPLRVDRKIHPLPARSLSRAATSTRSSTIRKRIRSSVSSGKSRLDDASRQRRGGGENMIEAARREVREKLVTRIFASSARSADRCVANILPHIRMRIASL